METTTTISTKADKDSDAKETVLTITWPDGQNSDVLALAQQALVVKLQGMWRKNGIPAQAKIIATDHAPGKRTSAPITVEGLAARAETMSAEDRKALMQKLQALLK